jgi:uncharacterized membrane protein
MNDRALAVLVIVIIAFAMLCELWLAPLRPGGSWLVFKVLPLVVLVRGLWQGRLKSQQWLSLIILIYVAEGIVRGMSDAPSVRIWGWVSAGLTTIAFLYCLALVKYKRQARP